MALVGCRWRGPGVFTFDLTWTPNPGEDLPAVHELDVSEGPSDVLNGLLGRVTILAGGGFSVTFDENEPQPGALLAPGPSTWSGSRSDWDSQTHSRCYASLEDKSAHTELTTIDPVHAGPVPAPQPTPAAPTDELVAGIDLRDRDAPFLPLAFLLAQPGLPKIDRIYLAAGEHLDNMTVELEGRCLAVTSVWNVDLGPERQFRVEQRIRCAPGRSELADDDPGISVPDDVWQVRLHAPPAIAQRVTAEVRRHDTSEPAITAAEAAFDPDAHLDALEAQRRLTEVARFMWRGGRVAAVPEPNNWGESFDAQLVAIDERINLAAAGHSCRAYASVIAYATTAEDQPRGFAMVITEQLGDRVTLVVTGQPERPIPLTRAAGQREGGLIDISDLMQLREPGALSRASVHVVDPTGADVPCEQY